MEWNPIGYCRPYHSKGLYGFEIWNGHKWETALYIEKAEITTGPRIDLTYIDTKTNRREIKSYVFMDKDSI